MKHACSLQTETMAESPLCRALVELEQALKKETYKMCSVVRGLGLRNASLYAHNKLSYIELQHGYLAC